MARLSQHKRREKRRSNLYKAMGSNESKSSSSQECHDEEKVSSNFMMCFPVSSDSAVDEHDNRSRITSCCDDTSSVLPSTVLEVCVTSNGVGNTNHVDDGVEYIEIRQNRRKSKIEAQQGVVHLCQTLETVLVTLYQRRNKRAFDKWKQFYFKIKRLPAVKIAISPHEQIFTEEIKDDNPSILTSHYLEGSLLSKQSKMQHTRHALVSQKKVSGLRRRLQKFMGRRDFSNVSQDWQALAKSFPWPSHGEEGEKLLEKLVNKFGEDDELLVPHAANNKTLLWHAVIVGDIRGVKAICQAIQNSDVHPEDVLKFLNRQDKKAKLTAAELAKKRGHTEILNVITEMTTMYTTENVREKEERKSHRRSSRIEQLAHNCRTTTIEHNKQKRKEADEKNLKMLKVKNWTASTNRRLRRGFSGFLIKRELADTTNDSAN